MHCSAFDIQQKCTQYWPENVNEPMDVGFNFTVILDNQQVDSAFILRKLKLTKVC